jgi:hypothetical protein
MFLYPAWPRDKVPFLYPASASSALAHRDTYRAGIIILVLATRWSLLATQGALPGWRVLVCSCVRAHLDLMNSVARVHVLPRQVVSCRILGLVRCASCSPFPLTTGRGRRTLSETASRSGCSCQIRRVHDFEGIRASMDVHGR